MDPEGSVPALRLPLPWWRRSGAILLPGRGVLRPLTALACSIATLARGGRRPGRCWLARRTADGGDAAARLKAPLRREEALSETLAAAGPALPLRSAELRTLLEVLPIGIAVAHDPACRRITANPALEKLLGVAPGTNVSKSAPPDEQPPFRLYRDGRELSPDELPMQQAAARGVLVADVELDVVWPDGTTKKKLLEWAAPLFDEEGGVRGSFLVVADITARKAAEEALAARVRQQAAVAELGQRALAGLGLATLMDEAVAVVARTLEVECAQVLQLLPGGDLLLRAGVGWPAGTVREATLEAGRASQAGYALLVREPVIVEDWVTETRFRQAPLLGALGVASGLTVPLEGGEQPFGVLGAHTTRRRCFTDDDVHFLQAVGHVLATALRHARAEMERARLLAREQAARAEAEATQRRTAFLAEASRQVAASLDSETTLASVARLAVPHVADCCVIDLFGADSSVRTVVATHVDPAKEPLLRALYSYPPGPRARHPLKTLLHTGKARLVAEVTDAWLARIAVDAEHLAMARRLDPKSAMCVPLIARGRTLGVLSLISAESGRRYGPADLLLAEELAHRAAVAIDNAWLYRQAQEAVRIRDDFLARASHELLTPLTVVKGHLAFLARRPRPGGADPAALVATAIRHVDRMTRLLADLLEASRLTTGRLRLQPEPLDLAGVAVEALGQAGPLAHEKGVALVDEVPAGLRLAGDRLKLEQVLVNLLTNAVKHTPAGGTVRVAGSEAGGQVELRVQDTGEGILREHLERIFEPFFQVQSATGQRKAAGGGAGLGLAIARQLVELHGGRIWAESDGSGLGSTFVVRLPAAPATGEAVQ